jgi:hypothetical protein
MALGITGQWGRRRGLTARATSPSVAVGVGKMDLHRQMGIGRWRLEQSLPVRGSHPGRSSGLGRMLTVCVYIKSGPWIMDQAVTCVGVGVILSDLIVAIRAWSDGWDQAILFRLRVLRKKPSVSIELTCHPQELFTVSGTFYPVAPIFSRIWGPVQKTRKSDKNKIEIDF